MKKPKLNLDAAKIQQFFFYHIEKILLGVVVCLMGFLIWSGLNLKGLDKSLKPNELKQVSTSTTEFIQTDRWAQIEPKFKPPMNIESQVTEGQLRTDPQAYFLPVSINRPNFPKHNPRSDPKLFPPEHLVVIPMFGPLAVNMKMGDVDPLPLYTASGEPAPVVRPKPKPKTKTPPPGSEGPLGSPDGGVPGPGGRTKKKKKGEENYDPLGGAPPPGGAFGGMPGQVDPTLMYPESISHGFAAQGEYTIARNTYSMVVMAAVPYLKQMEEFDRALAQSLDYDSNRDFPWYLNFDVQRVDVTANPAAPVDWSTAVLLDPLRGIVAKQIGKQETPGEWAGIVPEVVDLNYTDPKLTHPAPPYMQRDLWPLLTHPDIPLATALTGAEGVVPGAAPAAEDPNELFGAPGATPGAGPGGVPGVPRPGGFGGSQDGGRGAFRGGGEGGIRRPGSYDGGGGAGSGTATIAPPKFKLIRLTDTDVLPGRKYCYRVRVWLHDPNHPVTGMIAPSIASLDGAVQKRISEIDADVKAGKRKPQYASVITSDWSAPSPVVGLPSTSRFFSVSTPPPKERELIKGKPMVPEDQPKSEALVVGWDTTKVVDVPAEVTVYRGSLLNLTQDLKAIHPALKALVDLPKYPLATNGIVADIQGGAPIPPLEKGSPNAVHAPGEILIFDASGKMHVRDEVDDIENVRRYGIPKAPPPATTPGGDGQPGFDPLGSPDGGPKPKGRPASRPS